MHFTNKSSKSSTSMTTPSNLAGSQFEKLRKEEMSVTGQTHQLAKILFIVKIIVSIKILTIIEKLNFHN